MANIREGMEQRQCDTCGRTFRPKADWHKSCFDCAQKKMKVGGDKGPPGRNPNLYVAFGTYLQRLSESGYFNQEGYLRSELRVEDAEMVARVLAAANVSSAQLRRFFTMARSLEQRLNAGQKFDSIIPEIASLQPFAAAVIGREQNPAQRDRLVVLRDFIDTNAQLGRQDVKAYLEGFLPHFESVMAYFTLYKPK